MSLTNKQIVEKVNEALDQEEKAVFSSNTDCLDCAITE